MFRLLRVSVFILFSLAVISARGATQNPPHPVAYYNPVWSPDGRSIAFESNREGNFAVYLVEVDSRSLHRLTPADAEASQPAWSPDGNRIVISMRRGDTSDLYLVNRDGANLTRVTQQPGSQFYAPVSPDGRWLLFGVQFQERKDLYYVGIVQANGSGYRLLTDSTASSTGPRWSADGRRIEYSRTPILSPAPGEAMRDFARRRDAAGRLVSMAPDGSDSREIGPAPGESEPEPVDSPDGRYAVESRDSAGGGLYLIEKATGRERVLVGRSPPAE